MYPKIEPMSNRITPFSKLVKCRISILSMELVMAFGIFFHCLDGIFPS